MGKSTSESNLTLKQRKFLKIYLELGNATEAAMQVYDVKDRDSANAIGSENLAKLSYSDLMEEAGITDKLLQEKIMEGLEANRTISAIKGTKADGGTTDFIDVPDFMARHKYLETALKLKKRLNDREGGINADTVNLQINLIHNGFSRPKPFVATPNGSAERQAQIQDNNLAQTVQKDDNSDSGADLSGIKG